VIFSVILFYHVIPAFGHMAALGFVSSAVAADKTVAGMTEGNGNNRWRRER
jgi:hypothetical protein